MSRRQEFSSGRSISCSTSWSDHLLVHLLAFFDFLPERLMFPQILRSTQLDMPCLQQSRKKKMHYDCLLFEKKITRHVRRCFHKANIVVLCFAGHRTIEMLGLVGPKVWPVSNCMQQVPTSVSIVVVSCKQMQQLATLLGAQQYWAHVIGQQCRIHLHGP